MILRFLTLFLFSYNLFAGTFPSDIAIALMGDKISEHRLNKKELLKYRDVRSLEYLLYKHTHIKSLVQKEGKVTHKFSKSFRFEFDKKKGEMRYFGNKKFQISLIESEDKIKFEVLQKNKKIEEGEISKLEINKEYVDELRKELYLLSLKSKGMDTNTLIENVALNINHQDIIDDKPFEETIRIKEAIFKENENDTKWQYLPVKLIAYPVQKVFYDATGMITSTAVESVTRSPIHNIQGSVDEFKGSGVGFFNGLKTMLRGIFKPKRASFFDGVFEIGDASLRLVKGGLGIGKSAISVVAYPLYRAFGGKESKRVPLRGKRASILIVDTDVHKTMDRVVDSYGEQIIRGQLKSISQYFCMSSSAHVNDVYACIDDIPSNIQYVDFFALTHTGGTVQIEAYAKYAARRKGLKPELMVSIGCGDRPSDMSEKENSLGQTGTSWAVHYYLSNLISKRLRGIPMEVAANEAFLEGIPSNIVNPISIGAFTAISIMEEDILHGYLGSKPNIYNDYQIIYEVFLDSWAGVRKEIMTATYSIAALKNLHESDEYKEFAEKIRKRVKEVNASYEKLIASEAFLSPKSLEVLKGSKKLMHEIELLLESADSNYDLFTKLKAEGYYEEKIVDILGDKSRHALTIATLKK